MTSRYPFITALAGLLTGLMLARLGAGWCTLTASSLLTVWLAGTRLRWKRRSPAKAYIADRQPNLILAIVCTALGIGTAMLHAPAMPDTDKTGFPEYAEARVRDVRMASDGGQRIIADILAFRDEKDSVRNTDARNIRVLLNSKNIGNQTGDIILFRHHLEEPHDSKNSFRTYFADWARSRGITHTQSLGNADLEILRHRHSLTSISQIQRDKISTGIDRSALNRRTSGLLKAVTIGDTDASTDSLRDDFSHSGMAHLLSLSGLHVGIVAALIVFLLMPLNLTRAWRLRYPFAIAAVWAYVWLTGMHIPAVRAAIMLSFYLVGKLVERQTLSLNSLAGAAFIILLFSPRALFDTGFQLSCVSVLSLAGFSPFIQPNFLRRRRIMSYFYSTAAASFLATFGSAAIVTYNFGELPLYFLPSNLIAAPLLPVFMLSGTAHILLDAYASAPQWLTISVNFLSDSICNTASFFSKLPASTFTVGPSITATLLWTLALPVGIASLHAKMRKITRRITASAAGCLLVSAVVLTFCFPAKATTPRAGLIIQNVRSEMKITVLENGAESILYLDEKKDSTYTACGKRIVCIASNRYSSRSRKPYDIPIKPEICDILLIGKGYNSSLKDLLRYYSPGAVVSHGSVSSDIRISLAAQCKEKGIPYHSIREDGPYRIDL